MKAANHRFALTACMMLALAVPVSGCTVGGKSFAIDSNSRVPFFGLELKERKRKDTAPSYKSISRSSRDEVSVKVAFQNSATNQASDSKKHSSQPVSTQFVSDPVTPSTPRGKTGQPTAASLTVTQDPPVASIPLPRTDDLPSSRDRRAASLKIDFQ
ncbi:hypothetical protein [Schlesneria sp.]|uniref:hypothetical protein n=1 Tax=Schlesneria sp. TaxID=2762018 RepID=UPI002F020380